MHKVRKSGRNLKKCFQKRALYEKRSGCSQKCPNAGPLSQNVPRPMDENLNSHFFEIPFRSRFTGGQRTLDKNFDLE
jgi:hypothetical protein